MVTPSKKKQVKKTKKKAVSKGKKTAKKKPAEKAEKKAKPYFEGIGRRKTSTSRVRITSCRPFEDEKGRIVINQKPYSSYFPLLELQRTVEAPLRKIKSLNRFEVSVKVKGGGIRSQAEAIRHGLARALIKFNPEFSKKLKRAGYLRRDPRQVERKKPGLKKARRAPQWSKR